MNSVCKYRFTMICTDEWTRPIKQTFGFKGGNSWAGSRSLNWTGALYCLLLLLKASQIALWTALFNVSRPVRPIRARGLLHSSGGKSDMSADIFKWLSENTKFTTISWLWRQMCPINIHHNSLMVMETLMYHSHFGWQCTYPQNFLSLLLDVTNKSELMNCGRICWLVTTYYWTWEIPVMEGMALV